MKGRRCAPGSRSLRWTRGHSAPRSPRPRGSCGGVVRRPRRCGWTPSERAAVERARQGDPEVRVKLAPDDSLEITGRLAFVDNAIDPATGTLVLKGEFPNRDGRLEPGAFVEVRLVLGVQQAALVVPA